MLVNGLLIGTTVPLPWASNKTARPGGAEGVAGDDGGVEGNCVVGGGVDSGIVVVATCGAAGGGNGAVC